MKKQVFSFETRKEADGFSAGVAAVLPPDQYRIVTRTVWSRSRPHEVTLILSGEPPAPTPEPATCPKCAGVGGDAGGTACDLCCGTGRAPAAPTAATPKPEEPFPEAQRAKPR